MFFDQNGMLDLDEIVADNASFKKIMEDGIVSEDEIKEQSDRVISKLKDMESKYDEKTLQEVRDLISEFSVLYAIYEQYSLQSIR